MAMYEAKDLVIENVQWKAPPEFRGLPAVSVNVAIPVDVFTGLDLHRPITITQEES